MQTAQEVSRLLFFNTIQAYRIDRTAPYMKGLVGFLQTIDPNAARACTSAHVHYAWQQLPRASQQQFAAAYAQYCAQVPLVVQPKQGTQLPRTVRAALPRERSGRSQVKHQTDSGWQLSSVLFGLIVYVVGEMLVKAIALFSPLTLGCCFAFLLACTAFYYRSSIRQFWNIPAVPLWGRERENSGGYRLGRMPDAVQLSASPPSHGQVSMSQQNRTILTP